MNGASPSFSRYGATAVGEYYYDLREVLVNETGLYAFRTTARPSAIDPFCYIYKNEFDGRSPATNLLAYKNQSGFDSNSESQLMLTLESTERYYLVITTSGPSSTATFVATIRGPTSVTTAQIASQY